MKGSVQVVVSSARCARLRILVPLKRSTWVLCKSSYPSVASHASTCDSTTICAKHACLWSALLGSLMSQFAQWADMRDGPDKLQRPTPVQCVMPAFCTALLFVHQPSMLEAIISPELPESRVALLHQLRLDTSSHWKPLCMLSTARFQDNMQLLLIEPA